MGDNKINIVRASSENTEIKNSPKISISKKNTEGKQLVAFATLGCRVNHYETEAMAEKFIREGYEVTDFGNYADVYVINTCSVTNMSDKKSRQIIGRARRTNKDAIIAAVGCYSQVSPDEVAKIEGVDVVLGTRNKGDIVYYVNKAKDEQKPQMMVGEVLRNKQFEDLNIEEFQDKTRAFLKIQDGCNRFCAYCVIPYTRGTTCSKDPEKVLKEIKQFSISSEELANTKEQMRGSFILSQESMSAKMNAIGKSMLLQNDFLSEEKILSINFREVFEIIHIFIIYIYIFLQFFLL